MAIQKIQPFPAAQRNQVIQLVEFLNFTASQTATPEADDSAQPDPNADFFALAGMWKTKDITAEFRRP